jgi:hypothetical protein
VRSVQNVLPLVITVAAILLFAMRGPAGRLLFVVTHCSRCLKLAQGFSRPPRSSHRAFVHTTALRRTGSPSAAGRRVAGTGRHDSAYTYSSQLPPQHVSRGQQQCARAPGRTRQSQPRRLQSANAKWGIFINNIKHLHTTSWGQGIFRKILLFQFSAAAAALLR